jgi:F0F1-type ATP synthase assembly protein I
MNSEKPRRTATPGFLRQLALAMELPFIPVVAVAAGGGLGYLLDTRWHSWPAATLILGFLGFVGGLREVIRRATEGQKSSKD